jgi:YD repeat-containing protein
MVAIVSGNGFGLSNTSASVLGQQGLFGNAILGNGKEGAYVNIANGSLTLQDTDDFLAAQGFNIALTRTYNSLGNFNDGNGSGWKIGPSKQVTNLVGTLNTTGSTVTRIDSDGASTVYTYNSTLGLYRATDGAGGYDSLSMNGNSEWVWTSERKDLQGVVEYYDSILNAGHISRATDQDGNQVTYQYNADGQLSQVSDASGDTVYYDYTNKNLTKIRTVTAGGVTSSAVSYAYDTSNRLSTVTIDLSPADNSTTDGKTYVTTYVYRGTSNQILSTTQSDGTVLTFGYTQVPASTGPWLLTSVTDGQSRVTAYDYTSGGARTTKVTDPLGYITTYQYDAKNQLTDVTAPAVSGVAAQTTHYAYDGDGNVTSITDAQGQVTTYQYDGNGNRIYERDAAGNTITRSYDSISNKLLTETIYRVADPDGAGVATAGEPQTTNYVYDSGNHLRFVVSPEGRVVEYRYNAAGQRAAELHYATTSGISLASNATALSQATLDAMTTWATGAATGTVNRVDYNYDVRGLASQSSSYQAINSVATGTVQTRQYVYDQHGLLLKAIDGKGNATTYTYDGLGRRLSSQDALGNITTTGYDAAGNTVSVTQANGLIIKTAYDKDGLVKSVTRTNAANTALGATNYTYNSDNQVYKISDPAGLISYIIYDTAGRKVADIDAAGGLTEYYYNLDNQVTRTIRYATLVTAAKMTAITGTTALTTVRPTSAAGDISNWNLYDSAGRLSETLDALGNVTHYDYDGASRLVQTIQRATALTASQLTSLATVNAPTVFGAAAAATDRINRAFYDNDGQLLAKLDADGYLTEYSYDGLGQLIEIIAYATVTPAGQRATGTLATLRPATVAADRHQRYIYNAQGQVAADIDGNGYLTRTSYDSAGNATSVRRYTAAVTVPAGATLAAIDSLVASGSYLETLYTYSALNQRVTEKGADGVTTRTTYDNVGNVTEVRRALSTSDERTTQMRYDLLGNVIAQLTPAGAALLAGAATQAQIDAIWTANAVQYTYSADGLRTSMKDASGNRTLYYYDNDNKLVYTIEPNGAVTTRLYDAFDRLTGLRMGLGVIAASTVSGMTGGTVTTSVTNTVTAVQASIDSIEAFAYDKAGRVIDDTNPLGGHTLTNYDALGNVVQITQTDAALAALGTVVNTYDAAGRLLRSNDNGALTYYVYDALGRMVGKVAPNGALTEYVYDADNRLLRSTTYATAVNGAAAATLNQLRPAASADDRSQNNRYDGAGRLTDSVDAANFLTHYEYDGAGRVIKTTRYATAVAAGSFTAPTASTDDRTTRALYNAAGELVARLDADGYLTRYLYNGGGQLLESIAYANATPVGARAGGDLAALLPTTHSDDIHQHYLYNAAGQMVASVDGDNYLTEISYDVAGNVLKRTRRATAVTTPGAATVALMGMTANAGDQVISYTYSALHQVMTQTEPDGTVTRYTYDKMGNVTETRRALGVAIDERAIQKQYDALGRVTAELTPLGVAAIAAGTAVATAWASYGVKYTYNSAGQRASMTDQNGRRTLYYYDASGNLGYQINAAGEVNVYRYSLFNQQTAATEVNGRVAAATLATLTGNETAASIAATVAAITALGADSTQAASYDTLGRVIDRVDALGFHVTSSYDAFGDLLRSVDVTSGIATAYQYDHRGNLVSTTPYANVAGSTSSNTSYDGFGRVIARVDANHVGSTLGYDHQGHVVTLRDPSNPTASIGYDAFGRVLTQTDALGNVTSYAYDTAGLSYTVTTPEGVTHTTTLNHFGQTVSVAGAVGGVTKNTTTYVYDKNGNLTSVTDTTGRLQTNTYDNANLQLTVVDANSVTTSISYDAANRVLSRTVDPAGLKLLTSYSYDALGRVATVTDPGGVLTATSYDADGQVTAIVVDSGDASHLNLTTRFSYDSLGRKLSVTDPAGVVTTYSYDANGHGIASVVDNGGLNLTTQLIYDNTGKQLLLRASGQEVTRYAYDSAGNLTWQVDATGAVTGYTYDADNHLIKSTRYAKLSSLFGGAQPPAAGLTFTAAQIAASVSADGARDAGVRNFYDTDGRIYASVDALGKATVYLGYNAQGKATETISYSKPVVVTDSTTTAALKTLLAQAGQAAPTTDRHQIFNYDARGRLTAVLTAIGLNPSGVQQWELKAYAYDANGNLTSSIDYDTPVASNAPTAANIATWIAVMPAAGDVASYLVYDKANRVTASATLLRANSATGANEWAITTHAYDNNGNVVLRSGYATPLALNVGARPTSSNISTFTTTLANLNAADTQVSMVYDGANRLVATASAQATATSATAVSSWSISTQVYDADGNVVQRRAYATALKMTGNGKAPSSADIAAFTAAPANGSTADRQVYLGYDRANRLTSTASAGAVVNGVVQWELVSRQYDVYGNLVKLTQSAGAVDGGALGANLSAAALAARVVANSGDDRTTAYRYDLDNRLTETVDPAGYLVHYDYDSAGRVTQTTRYATALAAGGFAAPAASADDRITRTLYDVAGNLLGQLDADGYLVRNIYNAAGQLIETIAYANATPTGSRANGDLAALTPALSADDIHQHFLYNPAGQLIASVDGENYLVEFSYDAVGNLLKRTRHALVVTNPGATTVAGMGLTINAGDQVTSYTYTSQRQLLTQTDPDGTVTRYTYDGVGNQIELRRAVGASDERAVQSRYDGLGRLIAQLTPQGVAAIGASTDAKVIADAWTAYSVKYTYNGAGQRASMTDQDGNRTLYYYDLSGNLGYQVNAAGEVTAYSYSTFDQQTAITQVNGRIAATVLNAMTGNETAAGIAATVAAIATQGANPTIGARYDRLGRLIERTSALGYRGTNSYDAFGNLLRTVDVTSGIAASYQYDHRGNRLQSTPDNNPELITRTSYDAFGRAVSRTDANSVAHAVGYDRLGHAISFQDPANPTATVRYDAFGRVLSVTDKLGNATSYSYSYDPTGPAVTITTPEGVSHTTTQNHFGQTVTVADALNGSVKTTTTYVYDKNGNLTSVTDSNGKLQSATYDKANLQLTSVDGNNITTTVTYDAANRVLSRTVDSTTLKLKTSYSYDALGRQVTATDPNGVVTTTSYDADGQVTSIVADSGDAGHLNLTTRFSYDSLGRKLSVTDPAGVVTTYSYDANGHASGSVADSGGLNVQT